MSAAEPATEKVLSQVTSDFRDYGDGYLQLHLDTYMNPAGALTFNSDGTSSGTIIEAPNPPGRLPALGGTVSYSAKHDSGLSTLSLPIGTNNSPAVVQQVIMVPPSCEDPESSMGQQRYYKQADLILLVGNNSIIATNGPHASSAFPLPTNELFFFVSTNISFYNKREQKTIKVVQIDIAKLVLWNAVLVRSNWRMPASFTTNVVAGF